MNEEATRSAAIINDDITQLTTMTALLEKHGYTIIPCTSAEYALEELSKRTPPDIIITDIQMPGIDGWRFCQIIRSKTYKKLNSVPVIMISAVFKDEDVHRVSSEIGADAFLPVPVNPESLLNTIENLREKKRESKKTSVLIGGPVSADRKKLVNAFAAHGYKVITASDMSHTIQQYKNAQPSVVVISDDHSLSGGVEETIQEMRQMDYTVTLICCIPDSKKELCKHYVQAGADACLQPPFIDNYPVILCEKIMRERAFVKVEELLRKRTWELEESREKYKTMMDSMVDPIYICSPDYGIEYVNKAMIRLIGSNPLGKECYASIFGNTSPCSWCRLAEIKKGENVQFDIESDALHKQFRVTAAPLNHPDGKTSQLSILHDISQEKELENRLRHVQKMEALGHLAGGVAHDFNNILGAILGYADMVRENNVDESGTPVDKTLGRRMDTIIKATNRAGALVKQLLAFSRQGKYLNDPTDIHHTLKEAVTLLERTIDKRISIEIMPNAERSIITGDPHQLLNVFLNLGVNARDAMPGGGKLVFKTRCLDISLQSKLSRAEEIEPGPCICIDVSDTGEGIPAHVIGKIFDPFFTTKGQGKGTGLGLAGVYGTIKNHRGHIEVDSASGQGTVFTIYLPLASVAEAGRHIAPEYKPLQRNGSGTIMVVDDEDAIRDVARDILEAQGYRVVTFVNGRKAIDYYREHFAEVDLAIIDMIMPECNGSRCFNELKAIHNKIKAVLTTGYSTSSEAGDMSDDGILYLLKKPFSKNDLLEAVRAALHDENFNPEAVRESLKR
ncbi:MAG: response regulator [Chitinivibrionales bacterium]|nr:response regulator [Chitinivibrionales bacterium]